MTTELQIFPTLGSGPNGELLSTDMRRIPLSPAATVRIGERQIFIPRGETRIVGPWDGGYELLHSHHDPRPWRTRLRSWWRRLRASRS